MYRAYLKYFNVLFLYIFFVSAHELKRDNSGACPIDQLSVIQELAPQLLDKEALFCGEHLEKLVVGKSICYGLSRKIFLGKTPLMVKQVDVLCQKRPDAQGLNSCPYQALKNTLLIINSLVHKDVLLSHKLLDPLIAKKYCGVKKEEQGVWRSMITDYRKRNKRDWAVDDGLYDDEIEILFDHAHMTGAGICDKKAVQLSCIDEKDVLSFLNGKACKKFACFMQYVRKKYPEDYVRGFLVIAYDHVWSAVVYAHGGVGEIIVADSSGDNLFSYF